MKYFYLTVIGLVMLSAGCRKTENSNFITAGHPDSVTVSRREMSSWYDQQLRLDTGHKVKGSSSALQHAASLVRHSFSLDSLHADLGKAEKVMQGGHNWWVIALEGQPVIGGFKQGYRKLAIFRDSTGHLNLHILEIIPDPYYLEMKGRAEKSDFTGRIFIYDRDYHLLGGHVYRKGRLKGRVRAKTGTVNGGTGAAANAGRGNNIGPRSLVAISQDCEWVDNNYVDADGNAVIFSEWVCSSDIYDEGDTGSVSGVSSGGDVLGSGGGGGGTVASAPAVSNLPGETGDAIDPKQFMNCFGTLPDIGAKCTVTVYVVEPFPGTSFNLGPNSVGHTAIGLTKTYGNTTITQIVGYYPNASGLAKLDAPSKVIDNGGMDYNISVSYNVIPQLFKQIINFVANPPNHYNLYTYNCTNFVYDACSKGDITLPGPYSPVGFDATEIMTPAQLGSSISALTGYADVNPNGGIAPIGHGPCN